MQLTYAQKRALLDYLADPSNWQSTYDQAFYDHRQPNWRNRALKHITVSTHYKDPITIATHKDTTARLTVERRGDNVLISDESDHHLVRLRDTLVADHETISIETINSRKDIGFEAPEAAVFEIPDLNIFVRFNIDGTKSVFFDDLTKRGKFNTAAKDMGVIPNLGFAHVIQFDKAFMENLGFQEANFGEVGTIIIAIDMNMEPGLQFFNRLKPAETRAFMDDALNGFYDDRYNVIPGAYRLGVAKKIGDISHLEQEWVDSTDFIGHKMGEPKNFRVHAHKNEMKIFMNSDGHESVLAHAFLLKAARTKVQVPVETVNAAGIRRQIIHLLEHGVVLNDHYGREWNCVVVRAKSSPAIARQARAIAQGGMALSAYHFAAINFDEEHCLLAIQRQALPEAKAAMTAKPS